MRIRTFKIMKKNVARYRLLLFPIDTLYTITHYYVENSHRVHDAMRMAKPKPYTSWISCYAVPAGHS